MPFQENPWYNDPGFGEGIKNLGRLIFGDPSKVAQQQYYMARAINARAQMSKMDAEQAAAAESANARAGLGNKIFGAMYDVQADPHAEDGGAPGVFLRPQDQMSQRLVPIIGDVAKAYPNAPGAFGQLMQSALAMSADPDAMRRGLIANGHMPSADFSPTGAEGNRVVQRNTNEAIRQEQSRPTNVAAGNTAIFAPGDPRAAQPGVGQVFTAPEREGNRADPLVQVVRDGKVVLVRASEAEGMEAGNVGGARGGKEKLVRVQNDDGSIVWMKESDAEGQLVGFKPGTGRKETEGRLYRVQNPDGTISYSTRADAVGAQAPGTAGGAKKRAFKMTTNDLKTINDEISAGMKFKPDVIAKSMTAEDRADYNEVLADAWERSNGNIAATAKAGIDFINRVYEVDEGWVKDSLKRRKSPTTSAPNPNVGGQVFQPPAQPQAAPAPAPAQSQAKIQPGSVIDTKPDPSTLVIGGEYIVKGVRRKWDGQFWQPVGQGT